MQAFVEAYDGNATKAAIAAGVPQRSAAQQGAKWMRMAKIKEAIRNRADSRQQTEQRILTREDRQRFWSQMVTKAGVKDADRLKASELLGRSEADFTDTSRIEVAEGVMAAIARAWQPQVEPAPVKHEFAQAPAEEAPERDDDEVTPVPGGDE